MSGMTAFMIAVGGASLICYWLMNRVQNRSARRSPAGDGSDDGASYDSGGGWHAFNWFGGDSSTSDNSGPSGDSSGGDSSGGGDGGGGGGDGGGGRD
jgi:hypothetical protein